MKIYTEKLKKYANILYATTITGDRYAESLYLSISDSYLYFENEKFRGRVSIDIEVEPEDNIQDFYMNTKMFISLVKEYDYIKLDNEYNFSHENEFFNLPILKEKFDTSILNIDIDNNSIDSLEITSKIISDIDKAISYTTNKESLDGIYIDSNNIMATNRSRAYYTDYNINTNTSFEIPVYLAKILITGYTEIIENVENSNIKFIKTPNAFYISFNDRNFEIITPQSSFLKIPDINGFKSVCSDKNTFEVEKAELQSILKFFDPFMYNVSQEIIFSIINDKEIDIKIKESNVSANRIINVTNYNVEDTDFELFLNRSDLLLALNTIKDNFIVFKYDTEKSGILVTGKDAVDRNIILVKTNYSRS